MAFPQIPPLGPALGFQPNAVAVTSAFQKRVGADVRASVGMTSQAPAGRPQCHPE